MAEEEKDINIDIENKLFQYIDSAIKKYAQELDKKDMLNISEYINNISNDDIRNDLYSIAESFNSIFLTSNKDKFYQIINDNIDKIKNSIQIYIEYLLMEIKY